MSRPIELPEKIVWSELSVELRAVVLKWAREECADLRGANLRGADLRGANLIDANLRGATITTVDAII
jgi:uncharacterized protein YjbI with pentapeptide repeats